MADANNRSHAEIVRYYRDLAHGERKIDIELAVPIKVSGVETKTLTIRRPTVGDLRRAHKKEGLDAEFWMVATLADISPDELDQVDSADYQIIEAVVLGFREQRAAR